MTNTQLKLLSRNATKLANMPVIKPHDYESVAYEVAGSYPAGIVPVEVSYGLPEYMSSACPHAVDVYFFRIPNSLGLVPIWVVELPIDAYESAVRNFYRSENGNLLFFTEGPFIEGFPTSERTRNLLSSQGRPQPSRKFEVIQRCILDGSFSVATR